MSHYQGHPVVGNPSIAQSLAPGVLVRNSKHLLVQALLILFSNVHVVVVANRSKIKNKINV